MIDQQTTDEGYTIVEQRHCAGCRFLQTFNVPEKGRLFGCTHPASIDTYGDIAGFAQRGASIGYSLPVLTPEWCPAGMRAKGY